MRRGFTLIEIIVAIGIMLVLLTAASSSLQNANKRQSLDQVAENVRQTFLQAKSYAQAGKKDCAFCAGAAQPYTCGSNPAELPLDGWRVTVNVNNYLIEGRCGGTTFSSRQYDLPGYTLVANPGSVTFRPIGLGTDLAGTMTVAIYKTVSTAEVESFQINPSGEVTGVTVTMSTPTPAPAATGTPTPGATATPTRTPTPAVSNIVYEGTVTGGSVTSATVATSASVTGVSGNLYLASISTRGVVVVNGVSGLGATWTPVDGQCGGRNQTGVELWRGWGASSSGVVTATLASAPSAAVIAVSRFSGVNQTTPVGNVVSANSTVTGACSGGVDSSAYSVDLTVGANTMAFGAVALRATSSTPGVGFLEVPEGEVYSGSAGNVAGVVGEYKSNSSATTLSVNGTLSAVSDWAVIAVEIRGQSGGGATPTPTAAAGQYALRFYGHGVSALDLDRVKIQIDDPATSLPGPPADIGAADFTLEFWMKAAGADNTAAAVTCGANLSWINGNIVFDRDRFNQDRKFGLSLAGGRLVFGVSGNGTGDYTICGTTNVLDGQWHHVAVERRRSDGWMWLFVDGNLNAQADGPDGDISYPDNGVPGSFCGPGGNQPCTNSDPYLVIAAEKHDAGAAYPSYNGQIDETRLSNSIRYTAGFTRPSSPFGTDANTVALYHLDEGPVGACSGVVTDSSGAGGGPSNGVCSYGGSGSPGPEWVVDVPFGGGATPTPTPTSIPTCMVTTVTAPATMTIGGACTSWEVSAVPSSGTVSSVTFTTGNTTIATVTSPDASSPYSTTVCPGGGPAGSTTLTASCLISGISRGVDATTATLVGAPTSTPTRTPTPIPPTSTPTPLPPTPTPTVSNIAYQETVTGGSLLSTTVATSVAVTGVSGNLYLASISTRGVVAVSSVSGLGAAWTKLDGQCGGRNQTGVEVWRGWGASSSGTVTVTLASAPSAAVIAVSRFSGVNQTSPVGNVSSANTVGINGACSGGTDSAAYSVDLSVGTNTVAFGAVALRGTTSTPGAGFSEVPEGEVYSGSGGNVAGVVEEYKSISGAGTQIVNGSLSLSSDWAIIAVEIK